MRKKAMYIGAGMLAIIVLTCFIYVSAGTKNIEKLMAAYLKDKGYAPEEIHAIDVNHSFLNIILSYHEWSIQVQYVDEPEAIYIYTVENGQIKDSGVSGSVDKDTLKHTD